MDIFLCKINTKRSETLMIHIGKREEILWFVNVVRFEKDEQNKT